jgi:hypothetical protein
VTEDCRNDCTAPLDFPRRIFNRPGLGHLEYRIGTAPDFLDAMLRALDQNQELKAWTHRAPDDPGIALLEGAAILGDILTFYQELYANEAFLRTASWRESIADLVRLLGYRLAPGVGGKAVFAFEVKGVTPITIPAGFPLKAPLQGLEQPAEFETAQEALAYPWLSKFHLYRPLVTPNITPLTTEFRFSPSDPADSPVVLAKGDRLLVGDLDSVTNPTRLLNSEIVIVEQVRELHGVKLFKIKGNLSRRTQGDDQPQIQAYKLGRSFKHFGHNAPPKVIGIDANHDPVEKDTEYSRPYGKTANSDLYPTLEPSQFPLDNEVLDLPMGAWFIFEGILDLGGSPKMKVPYSSSIAAEAKQKSILPEWLASQSAAAHLPSVTTLITSIAAVQQVSLTWGALTGRATIVTLPVSYNSFNIQKVQFHEVVGSLELRAAYEEPEGKGKDLCFYGTEAQAQTLVGRNLSFTNEGGFFTAKVDSVQSLVPALAHLNLVRPVSLDTEVSYADFPNENPQVTVYGNLVAATQGKTEREAVLGNGDSRQPFQTFKLPKAPLTYHLAPGETPPQAPELQIYVNDRLWRPVPTFFSRGADEEIYLVREDAKGDSWVQFGDAQTGKRLPSGVKNVVVRYRTGVGAHGLLQEGATVQAGARLDRLEKIHLSGVVGGGADPESGVKARQAAPGKVQSLDRLVSLQDFESETLAIPGVAKVAARWDLVEQVPTVVLTVLMETGREQELEEVRQTLARYNRCRGPQRFPIQVDPGSRTYVQVTAEVALDPTLRQEEVFKAIKGALGLVGEEDSGVDGSRGLFALGQRRFGEPEYATRIAGAIQKVPGVLWTRVKGLIPSVTIPSKADGSPVLLIPCGKQQILALLAEQLQLLIVSLPAKETC